MYHEIRLISSCLWPLLYLVQKDKETDKIAKTKKEDIVAYIPLKAPLTAKEAIQAVLCDWWRVRVPNLPQIYC
jgi:hypothetical protein